VFRPQNALSLDLDDRESQSGMVGFKPSLDAGELALVL
jgi:hypothetical protein